MRILTLFAVLFIGATAGAVTCSFDDDKGVPHTVSGFDEDDADDRARKVCEGMSGDLACDIIQVNCGEVSASQQPALLYVPIAEPTADDAGEEFKTR